MAAYTSQQIMRNDDRHAARVDWSPDGTVILIHMNAPNGSEITFLPRDHQANQGFRAHPYPDATWSPSGTSVIVSGRGSLGRILLDAEQTFIPFNLSGIPNAHAATETADGRILFLGSNNSSLRLYSQGKTPTILSGEIPGQVVSWEWNRQRSALLLTVDTSGGRRLWVIGTDGSLRDVTPPQGVPPGIYWR
jgi:dipeptidyl aminopeptidase/acylaminoacyl peptidase